MAINYNQRPIVHHQITLKPHHKWLIGSFTGVIIVFMITMSVFLYTLSVKEQVNYDALNKKLQDLKQETTSNLNSLTSNINQLSQVVINISSKIGSLGQEFDILKATAGEDFSGIINSSIPSVVTIRTDVAQGTGFIIRQDGYIVTNAHVLSGASYVNAITFNQQTLSLSLVGYDLTMDIALLKTQGNFRALTFGDSDKVQVGEKVIAIGNPLGLQFSVTQGIVSAIHRTGPNGLNAYLQTDASLNPGNSGGPLIDKNGGVIGINNFKISSGENVGFALESNYIKQTVNKISQQALNQTLV